MLSKKRMIAAIASATFLLSFAITGAAGALTTSCVGVPSVSNITWTASSLGGVAPIAFLWGNGSTSSVQIIAVSPGTYSMTLQATDASSTMATTTCMATVVQPSPTITSFVANPTAIINGQSSILSWVVVNASSTSLDHGIGAVSSTSITVTPSVTTTYTLSATNPSGTGTASAIVTVNATSTGTTIQTLIQNLLNQIANLKTQILQLLLQQQGGGTSGGTATSTVTCIKFNKDLAFGDDGDDVKNLQQTLSSDPTIFPPGLITGFFGHKTQEALKKFQKKFGIGTTTGFFGPKTRGLLNGQCDKQEKEQESHKMSTSTSSQEDQGNNNNHNSTTSTSTWFFQPQNQGGNQSDNGGYGKGYTHGD